MSMNERDARVFGANLRRWRRYCAEMTQAALAERLGVTRQTLSRMEAGDPAIAVGTWLAAWALMGVLDEVSAASASREAQLAADLSRVPGYGGRGSH